MEKQMYQRAEIHLPRKKKVWDSFHSNTFRIFDETLPEHLDPAHVYQNHQYPTRDPQETETRHIPHPQYAKSIRTNVRFLNEPVSYMETQQNMTEQFNWWSISPVQEVHRKTQYSKSSTQRRDFQPITDVCVTRVREGNRPSATGIIPTLSSFGQPEKALKQTPDSQRTHDQPHQISKVTQRSCVSQGGDGAQRIPEHRGVTFALGRDRNLLNCSQLASLSTQQMWEHREAQSIHPDPRD